jgi:hypothetical protein
MLLTNTRGEDGSVQEDYLTSALPEGTYSQVYGAFSSTARLVFSHIPEFMSVEQQG